MRRFIPRLLVALSMVVAGCSSDKITGVPAPTLSALGTASAVQGSTATVGLTGTNFVPGGTTVVVSGTGVSVSGVTVTTPTSATATLAIAADAQLGSHTLAVKTPGGTSATLSFTVNPATPTLTAVLPASGVRGGIANVSFTGTNFVSGATTVNVSGSGVIVRNVSVSSPTTMTADFVIDAATTLDNRTVSVTTAGGTSASQSFTITPQAPTLTSLSEPTGVIGTMVNMTLTGTNFVPGAIVAVSGTGVTVTQVTVASESSITASFIVAADATLGDRTVNVATVGGTTAAQTFTVIPPRPTLTGISPDHGRPGDTLTVTITGVNFVAGATTVVPGVTGPTGVIVSDVNVTSSTSLTARFVVSVDAALGARNLNITTPGGSVGGLAFTVIPPGPRLTSLAPSSGVQGTSQAVTLTGTNFVAGATVSVDGSGVTVSNVTVLDGSTITADFAVDASAALAAHNVTVTTAGGMTNAQTFTVLPPAPTLTAIAPSSGVQGTSQTVTLTGTNFITGASVAVGGTGVTVSNVTVVNGTTITADFAVAAGATLGAHNVTVTTAGGTTAAQTFTVVLPPPTFSGLSLTTGAQTGTQHITLTGTNFQAGATTVNVSGSNVTVSNVNVASGTSLTADFAVAASATLGARNVTVTTAGGTSGAQTFTVIAAPVINSFAARATHVGPRQSVTLTFSISNGSSCVVVSVAGASCSSNSMIVTPGATTTYTLNASSAGATVTAQTTIFANEPGRWLYSSASTNSQLRMWSIDPTTGDVTAIGGGTVGTALGPNDVAVDPSGRFAYAADRTAGRVSQYTVDATTGALTPIGGGSVAASAGSYAIVVDPTGRYVYVVNDVSAANGSSISAFTIASDGSLVANGTSAIGNHAQGIAVDPLGQYLYATNQNDNTISMFKINADGTLAANGTVAVPGNGAQHSQPRGITVDPTSRFVYVTERIGARVHAYAINSDGTLTAGNITTTSSGTETHVAVDATGRFAYVPDLNSGIIHTFSIDQISGDLTEIAGIGAGQGVRVGTEWITADPQGKFMYTGNNFDNTISVFSINQSNGQLTFVATHAAGSNAQGLAVSR